MSDLTSRQREILLLMMDGLSNKAITECLCIEQSTLKRHRQNLYRKTSTHDAVALVAWGHRYLQVELLQIDRLIHSTRLEE